MVKVLYTKFSKPLSQNEFDGHLRLLPNFIQKQILKFKKWQDQHCALLGKLLLIHALDEFGLKKEVLHSLQFSEFGKPYLEGKFNFNIAHSDQVVVCCFSKYCSLGVDVEKITGTNPSELNLVFTKAELDEIQNSPNPQSLLFNLWTKKEAVIKADGRGFQLDALDISVSQNPTIIGECSWFLQRLDLYSNYSCHLATDKEILTVNLKELTFD